MSGINRLATRLAYRGGDNNDRLVKDKLTSLKRALGNSYQAETAIIPDGREFRCLINSNKETPEYDNKIISIPYEDICLKKNKSYINTTVDKKHEHLTPEKINLKCGDVFTWKETNTHWLVYLQYLEENAYFRAQIRRCDQEIEIDGKHYWVYLRGPTETSITWNQKAGVEWNDLNYSLVMYITRDDVTADHFHRFTKVKIIDPTSNTLKTWQVVSVDPYFGDGIIQVFMDEFFENSIQDAVDKEKQELEEQKSHIFKPLIHIEGKTEVYGYSMESYYITNAVGGKWFVKRGDEEIFVGDEKEVTLDINMKKGVFTLLYKKDGEILASLDITVTPF